MRRAVFVGLAGSPGVGVGRLLQVNGAVGGPSAAMRSGRRDDPPSAAPKPADPSRERALLEAALFHAAEELEALARQTTDRAGAAVGAIFEAQALFARDPGIVDPAFALIAAGIAADEAISRVTEERADALAAVDDEYFRERVDRHCIFGFLEQKVPSFAEVPPAETLLQVAGLARRGMKIEIDVIAATNE